MRVPATDEQIWLLRQLAPFIPGGGPRAGRSAYTHARAAEAAIAAAVAGGAGAAAAGPGAAALPSRAALVADCRRMWAAGLRPKHSWMGINPEGDLVLDLLSGSYIWLRRVRPGVGGDGGAEGGTARKRRGAARAGEGEPAADEAPDGGEPSDAAASSSGSSNSGGASSGGGSGGSSDAAAALDPERWPRLDPAADYVATLQLPDGRHVPLTPGWLADDGIFGLGPAAAGGGGGGDTQQRGAAGGGDAGGDDASGASGGGGAPPGRPRRGTAQQLSPAPLHRALAKAELMAGRLSARGLAFLQQKQAARVVCAVGGWKIAGGHEGLVGHYLTPAGARPGPGGRRGIVQRRGARVCACSCLLQPASGGSHTAHGCKHALLTCRREGTRPLKAATLAASLSPCHRRAPAGGAARRGPAVQPPLHRPRRAPRAHAPRQGARPARAARHAGAGRAAKGAGPGGRA